MEKYKKQVEVLGNGLYRASWLDTEENDRVVLSREFEVLGNEQDARAVLMANLDGMRQEKPELFPEPVRDDMAAMMMDEGEMR